MFFLIEVAILVVRFAFHVDLECLCFGGGYHHPESVSRLCC